MIRVLIIAEHAVVRTDLVTILQLAEGIQVAGCAGSQDAIAAAQTLSPDVIIVDMEMPSGSAYRLAPRLREQAPASRLVALTAHDYPAARERDLASGADAIIIKGTNLPEAIQIIQGIVRDPTRRTK